MSNEEAVNLFNDYLNKETDDSSPDKEQTEQSSSHTDKEQTEESSAVSSPAIVPDKEETEESSAAPSPEATLPDKEHIEGSSAVPTEQVNPTSEVTGATESSLEVGKEPSTAPQSAEVAEEIIGNYVTIPVENRTEKTSEAEDEAIIEENKEVIEASSAVKEEAQIEETSSTQVVGEEKNEKNEETEAGETEESLKNMKETEGETHVNHVPHSHDDADSVISQTLADLEDDDLELSDEEEEDSVDEPPKPVVDKLALLAAEIMADNEEYYATIADIPDTPKPESEPEPEEVKEEPEPVVQKKKRKKKRRKRSGSPNKVRLPPLDQPSDRPRSPCRQPAYGASDMYPVYQEVVNGIYKTPVRISIFVPESHAGTSFTHHSTFRRSAHEVYEIKPHGTEESMYESEEEEQQQAERMGQDAVFNHGHSIDGKKHHEGKSLRSCTIKVRDLKTGREANYPVIMRDFKNLFGQLTALHKGQADTVKVYFRPTSLGWWARNVKYVLFIYDKPNKDLGVLVNKKMIKGMVRHKLKQHHWMMEQEMQQQELDLQSAMQESEDNTLMSSCSEANGIDLDELEARDKEIDKERETTIDLEESQGESAFSIMMSEELGLSLLPPPERQNSANNGLKGAASKVMVSARTMNSARTINSSRPSTVDRTSRANFDDDDETLTLDEADLDKLDLNSSVSTETGGMPDMVSNTVEDAVLLQAFDDTADLASEPSIEKRGKKKDKKDKKVRVSELLPPSRSASPPPRSKQRTKRVDLSATTSSAPAALDLSSAKATRRATTSDPNQNCSSGVEQPSSSSRSISAALQKAMNKRTKSAPETNKQHMSSSIDTVNQQVLDAEGGELIGDELKGCLVDQISDEKKFPPPTPEGSPGKKKKKKQPVDPFPELTKSFSSQQRNVIDIIKKAREETSKDKKFIYRRISECERLLLDNPLSKKVFVEAALNPAMESVVIGSLNGWVDPLKKDFTKRVINRS